MSTDRRRIVVTVAIGVIVAIAMVLFGMEPRLVLLACVVAALAGAGWLLVDLAPDTGHIIWNEPDASTETVAGADHRVHALRARLRRSSRPGRLPLARAAESASTDEIISTLLALLDDHLLAERNIDRRVDPDAAAEALGPELARFVEQPDARTSMTQRRSLPRTLALIEAFVADPTPAGGPTA